MDKKSPAHPPNPRQIPGKSPPNPPIPSDPRPIPLVNPQSIPKPGPESPNPPPYRGGLGIGAGATRNQPMRLSQTPQPTQCPTCHQPTITALDSHRAAITAKVDPYPLTPHGEVWALQHNRATYQHTPTSLTRRDRWNIPGRPPTQTRTVLTEHRCHQPIPQQHIRPAAPKPPQRPQEDQCPF